MGHGLHLSEDERATIFQNVDKYNPEGTMLCPRRHQVADKTLVLSTV